MPIIPKKTTPIALALATFGTRRPNINVKPESLSKQLRKNEIDVSLTLRTFSDKYDEVDHSNVDEESIGTDSHTNLRVVSMSKYGN